MKQPFMISFIVILVSILSFPCLCAGQDCKHAGNYVYGLVTNTDGKWIVVIGRIDEITEQYEDTRDGYSIVRVPTCVWMLPPEVFVSDPLGDINNIFCYEREAREEAIRRNSSVL